MITYQVEQWRDIVHELEVLWPAHWEETARDRDLIKLAPNYKAYEAMADDGSLHVVTGREAGTIVGYHITIVRPHIHYMHDLHGFTDVYYIYPEYRQGWTGIKLFKYVEKTLKARGVVKLFTGTKLHLDMGPLFERMGWHETERLYTKVLNDQDIHQPHVPRVQTRQGPERSGSYGRFRRDRGRGQQHERKRSRGCSSVRSSEQ